MPFSDFGTGIVHRPYFINAGVIKKVLDIHSKDARSVPRDGEIGVELTISLDTPASGGIPKEISIYVTGRPKGEGNPFPWAGAFNVRDLMQYLPEYSITNDVFDAELLNILVGQRIHWIRYKTTDGGDSDSSGASYRTYKNVGKNSVSLENKFVKDAEGGYVYKFVGLNPQEGADTPVKVRG